MDEYHYNLVLFKEIKRFIQYRHQLGTFAVFSNLFGNILIFMPVGYFSAMAGKRRSFFKTLFWSFCLTLCVELMQLITKVGCFDVDDILLNKNDEREKNQKKEKERKSNQSKKYGKAAYLQSRRGVISCWLTGWSLAILLGCVGYAFLTRGKAAGIVGGIAILSLMIDIYGIWNAIEGFEEQDRKYLSCKCGIGIGIVQILCFLGIFVGGLSL